MSLSKSASVDDKKKRRSDGLSVQDIMKSNLTPIAQEYWAHNNPNLKPFDPKVIEDIYYYELVNAEVGNVNVSLLEISSYLENYLWKNFNPETTTYAHVMSIVIMLNEKFHNNISLVWKDLESISTLENQNISKFIKLALSCIYNDPFFHSKDAPLLSLSSTHLKTTQDCILPRERNHLILFATHVFSSLENDVVRPVAMELASLSLWRSLSPSMLTSQLQLYPEFAKTWRRLKKQNIERTLMASCFLPHILHAFLALLSHVAVKQVAYATGHSIPGQELWGNLSVPLRTAVCVGYTNSSGGLRISKLKADDNRKAKYQKGKGKGSKGKNNKHKRARRDGESDLSLSAVTVPQLSDRALSVLELHDDVVFLERTVAMLNTLVSQVPTRRFVLPLLEDMHLVDIITSSSFIRSKDVVDNMMKITIKQHGELYSKVKQLRNQISALKSDKQTGKRKMSQRVDSDSDSDSDSSDSSDSDSSDSDSDSESDSDNESEKDNSETSLKLQSLQTKLHEAVSAMNMVLLPRPSPSLTPTLLCQLLASLIHYTNIQCDRKTATMVGDGEMVSVEENRLANFQRRAFEYYESKKPSPQEEEDVPSQSEGEEHQADEYEGLQRLCHRTMGDIHLYLESDLECLDDDELIELMTACGLTPFHAHVVGVHGYGYPQLANQKQEAQDKCEEGDKDEDEDADAPESPFHDFVTTLFSYIPQSHVQQFAETITKARHHLERVLLTHITPRSSHKHTVAITPSLPAEHYLFLSSLSPRQQTLFQAHPVPLPCLSLQYLNYYDYLVRNYVLYMCEVSAQIRGDLENTITKMHPVTDASIIKQFSPHTEGPLSIPSSYTTTQLSTHLQNTYFSGKSPYGLSITNFTMKRVLPPDAGSVVNKRVQGQLTVDLSRCSPTVRAHWNTVGSHHVLYLCSVVGQPINQDVPAKKKERYAGKTAVDLGLVFSRGFTVTSVSDETGGVIGARDNKGVVYSGMGNIRVFHGDLDPAQYYHDQQALRSRSSDIPSLFAAPPAQYNEELIHVEGEPDVYDSFNLVVRRDPETNTFKHILDNIKHIITQQFRSQVSVPLSSSSSSVKQGINSCSNMAVVPDWLYPVVMGFNNPDSASYYSLPQQSREFVLRDSLVDDEHLLQSFVEAVHLHTNPNLTDLENSLSKGRHGHLLDFSQSYAATHKKATSVHLLQDKLKSILDKTDDFSKNNSMNDSVKDGQSENTEAEKDASFDNGVIVATPTDVITTAMSQTSLNSIRYTPTQIDAIKGGLHHGLNLIVGPPGTGKTDTAVQLISELHHNYRHERILVISHSNSAINDLLGKLMKRDVEERYVLRLGYSQQDLMQAYNAIYNADVSEKTNLNSDIDGRDMTSLQWQQLNLDHDFSLYGRVNYMLSRRTELLAEVTALGTSLLVAGEVGYSCETAGVFYNMYIEPPIKTFLSNMAKLESSLIKTSTESTSECSETNYLDVNRPVLVTDEEHLESLKSTLISSFPFTGYFRTKYSHHTLFPSSHNYRQLLTTVATCISTLQTIFTFLRETQPFEVLRTYKERTNYILSKHAKVVAMTCSHANIKREDLQRLQFSYDTVIIEEAGQILDIETFIPLFLQASDRELGHRLKRVVLLGDTHQLSPIVKSSVLQRHCNFSQSLFERLVRLGVTPTILNAQGRMRPSIAQLWTWQYARYFANPDSTSDSDNKLTEVSSNGIFNLPNPRYQTANSGLYFEYQFIHVDGEEIIPQPNFVQNLKEAEYVVSMYQYMRLMNYKPSSITILCAYNGQVQLVSEILSIKCKNDPLYGLPHVTTIDKYQGQQNDYILLSLVRSAHIGYLRDIRRMIVALSRAKLGLYIFGNMNLFSNSYELSPVFVRLMTRPTKLLICPSERSENASTTRACATAETIVSDSTETFVVESYEHFAELVSKMMTMAREEYAQREAYYRQLAEEEMKAQREREAALKSRMAGQEDMLSSEVRQAIMNRQDEEFELMTAQNDMEIARQNM